MQVEPKPAYLKANTPKQALLSFHSEQVEYLRESLREQRDFAARHHAMGGGKVDAAWFAEYDRTIAEAKWEDGSVSAVWRDRLAFHEAALEYLING